MGRGDFKFLLLDVVKDSPMHGYEIMKVVNEKCGGSYMRSPGLIYPLSRCLRI